MSDFSPNFPDHIPKIKQVEELYPKGYGVQYAKIPRNLIKLGQVGATPSTILVAIALADFVSTSYNYPTFELKRSKLSEVTGLSERHIARAIEWLTLNKVIFVRSRTGQVHRYTFNEDFLKTSDKLSAVPVTQCPVSSDKLSGVTSDKLSGLYIELILDLFYKSSFKEFFDDKSKFYSFYIPKRKSKKGDSGPGETIQVSRDEAWRDAVWYVWGKIQHEENPLTRIYLGLVGPYRMNEVRFPKKALLYRVNDFGSINEARQSSHLKTVLHDDRDFQEFLNQKRGTIGNVESLH